MIRLGNRYNVKKFILVKEWDAIEGTVNDRGNRTKKKKCRKINS